MKICWTFFVILLTSINLGDQCAALKNWIQYNVHWQIHGGGGAGAWHLPGTLPLGPIFFRFHAVFVLGKLGKINRLAPPPLWLAFRLLEILDPPLISEVTYKTNINILKSRWLRNDCTSGVLPVCIFAKAAMVAVTFWWTCSANGVFCLWNENCFHRKVPSHPNGLVTNRFECAVFRIIAHKCTLNMSSTNVK